MACVGTTFATIATEHIAAENNPAKLLSPKEQIHKAIVKFEKTERKLWSCSISCYETEEGDISSSIEQYSPQLRTPWLLLQLNGEQPTKNQMNNFSEKKQEQISKNESKIQLKLRKLINQESLSLISSDNKYIVMVFNVHLKKLGKDSVGKLKGGLS